MVGSVTSLRRERTFDLQAAYAAATRRRTDGPEYGRAAELLETALLARRHRVLAGPRSIARAEVLAPLYLSAHLLHVVSAWWNLGWTAGLAILVVYLAGGVGSCGGPSASGGTRRYPAPSVAEGGRTDLERSSNATSAVIRAAEEGHDPDPPLSSTRRSTRRAASARRWSRRPPSRPRNGA